MSIPEGIPKGWRMYQKHPVMKRYASYPHHFACFSCRKMFNKQVTDEMVKEYTSPHEFHRNYHPPCPECGQAMLNMGNGFKPPKGNDIKRWQALEKQARAGRRFWYCPSWL